MKKQLRLLILTLLCAVFNVAQAETFTFSTMGYENAQEVTEVKGTYVTITLDKGEGTSPKYYNSGSALRVYAKNTVTFTSAKEISSIQFTCVSDYAITADYKFSTGEFADGTWTGKAKEVSLTNLAEKSNQWRFVEITVNFADGTVSKTNPGLKIDDVTINKGESAALKITTKSDGALTFSTSNADVATVEAANGSYTLKAGNAGNATINVTQAETDNYTSAETSFNVKVVVPGETSTVQPPYTVNFQEGQGDFTIEDISNPDNMEIWKQGSSYGMTASGYIDKSYHASESWLISPVIDLTGVQAATLAFSDNWNKYFGDYDNDFGVFVREEGGQWTKLNITYTKPSSTYNGWDDKNIDLAAYVGKKIQVGFKYTSTTEAAGTYEVKSFSVTAGQAVEKEEAGLSYDVDNFTAFIGEANTFPTLNNPNGLAVTYSTTTESIATIDATTGAITLVAPGQTTVKATAEETDKYKAGTATYLLVVKEKAIAGTEKFALVADASALAAGDRIIIVNEESTYAISTTQNANNRAATDVQLESDGTITASNIVQVITLEGNKDAWLLNAGTGYLCAPGTTGNWLRTEETADEKAQATISIADGVATIQFKQWDESARTLLRFNPNKDNPIFSCYGSISTVGSLVRIYKSGDAPEKTLTISGTTPFTNETTVTITPSNADYAVYYTTDGTDPRNGGKVYAGPFTINATTTVKAVEEDYAGELSQVVEKTFVKEDTPDTDIVENIAAFKALEDGKEATLKLNNAQVLYVGTNDTYIRDASGAIDFYQTGLSLEAGQVLNGTVTGKKATYNNIPEMAKTDNTNADAFTATAGKAEPKVMTVAQAKSEDNYCDLIKIEGVKIVSKVEGKYTNIYAYVGNDSIWIYDRFKVGLGDWNENDTYNVEGILVPYSGKYEIYVTQPLTSGETPDPGVTTCANIAEFKALNSGTEAKLTLNNAVVLYAKDRDVFVRDASGAIEFYNTGITFTNGQILNGFIIGKYSPFNNLPELAKTDKTNDSGITFSEGGAPTPVKVKFAELFDMKYLCDLLEVEEVLAVQTTDGNIYASIEGQDQNIQLFDKFKVAEGGIADGKYNIYGILSYYKDKYQLYPIGITPASGINDVVTDAGNDAPAYNISGQRVQSGFKGIVIQNGRKFIRK